MEPQKIRRLTSRVEPWMAFALCAVALAAKAAEPLVRDGAANARLTVSDWLMLAATLFAAAGLVELPAASPGRRGQRVLRWGSLLLMIWAANGLPFDLLRMVRLIPLDVDWPGLATRTLACAAAVMLAHLILAHPTGAAGTTRWYGYVAFVLALPYPVLRTWWALGGTIGLMRPDAGGHGWLPWLACLPWLLAAGLSLLLVSTWRWVPRRLVLVAGWFATAFVALVGPVACWTLIPKLLAGADQEFQAVGMAAWVPALFYGSWLLWAVAAGAATHAYHARGPVLPAAASV